MKCIVCGTEIEQPTQGRPKLYCSSAHRTFAYVARRIQITPELVARVRVGDGTALPLQTR